MSDRPIGRFRTDVPSIPPVTPGVGASTGAVTAAATGAAASVALELPQPMVRKKGVLRNPTRGFE